ncbi:Gfo/Idh/MocA family protein [Nonomuraea dietziae]|uniref:Gfo/Idh/MocA family protein n=1 Tax=Nonomuraea dietziae TaxID=65515 RepID=UPI0033D66B15
MTFDTVTEDRPLRAVIAGAGFIGRQWATELLLHPDVSLVGWADIDPSKVPAGRGVPAFGSVAEMVEAVRPDFLVNGTVPAAHHEVTLAALERGVSVLSEKPMAVTFEEGADMVAAADRARRLFMVSQNRRYLPGLVAYRRTVAELGQLAILTSEFYIPYKSVKFLEDLPHPLIQDMAIHLFDAARAISGADPMSVYCESFRPAASWYTGACSATAIFEMTGGLRYVFSGSWSAPGLQTSWTGSWRAIGARGTAVWDGGSAIGAEGVTPVELEPDPHQARDRFPGLAWALEEFVGALRTGRPPQGEGHDNLASLAMVTSALESALRGERIKCPLYGAT